MKTSLPYLSTVIIIIASAFVLVNCKEEPACPDGKEETKQIDEMETFYWPYRGNDTLGFIRNEIETVSVYGKGRIYYFETESIRDHNPDCNVFYTTHYEAYTLDFSSQSMLIQVKQRQLEPAFEISYSGSIFKFPSVRLITGSYDCDIRGHIYTKVARISNEQGDSLYVNKANGILKIYNKATNKSIEISH